MDKKYFSLLHQEIFELGLKSYFTFTGYVNNIADYISGFTVMLHTALNEPFGRVLIEAAASAKPVIAYASGGPSEIIRNGETGYLVNDGQVDEMARLTNRLLSDPELRETIGQTAQKDAICRFNSQDCANRVFQILMND